MKKLFPGHFNLPEVHKKKLWDNSVFVFDTNILLGLYRYSDETRKKFIEILEGMKNRCWIPHQTASEYFRNRLGVISQQEQSYAEAIKNLDQLEAKFKVSHQHPFLSELVLEHLCQSFSAVRNELEKSRQAHNLRISNDEILEIIGQIFDGRVGNPFSSSEIVDLVKEGKERYSRDIPPGFKDAGKSDEIDPTRPFGDLIMWKQIIDYSKSQSKNVIFVCDDKKDDWWQEFKGKTIGPRPELVKEFTDLTSQDFLMYRSHRFLEHSAQYFGKDIPQEVVSEIRDSPVPIDLEMRIEYPERTDRAANSNLRDQFLRARRRLAQEQDEMQTIEEKLRTFSDHPMISEIRKAEEKYKAMSDHPVYASQLLEERIRAMERPIFIDQAMEERIRAMTESPMYENIRAIEESNRKRAEYIFDERHRAED